MSNVLAPYRVMGLVANDVPAVVHRLGANATFLVTCVGSSFHVYNADRLRLALASRQHPQPLTALEAKRELVFAASGSEIYVWKRNLLARVLKGHTDTVFQLNVFGDDHLISLGEDGRMIVWELPAGSVYSQLSFDASFEPSCFLHPHTYLNKVLVGSRQGALQLWNIKTGKCIYEFAGWGSAVTCLAQAPALDVVAVGTEAGDIIVHNLKFDKTIMRFRQVQGRVTALSFRTDAKPYLASGTALGQVVIWDLETRALAGATLQDAHHGPVATAVFLRNEPILITTAGDNSIRTWIFDRMDGTGRLLRSRSGHAAPPTQIRFYRDGTQLLSAGLDQALRFFSTVQDARTREFSQGSLEKRARELSISVSDLKLPPIHAFAAAPIRERDWDNIVSCHDGDTQAYTWRHEKMVRGEHVLKPSSRGHAPVRSVMISVCGNYAVIGTAHGWIEKFNLQSGKRRGKFCPPGVTDGPAHDGAVESLASDIMGLELISGGTDGKLKFWSFQRRSLSYVVDVGTGISQLEEHPDSSLLAVACEDFVIRMYDPETRRLIRRFEKHSDLITDIAFSPDARWLVSASMDTTLCIWDLPSGRLVDVLNVDRAVTGVAFSPTGDYIATSHANSLGIFLWSNRAQFAQVYFGSVGADAVEAAPTVQLDLSFSLQDDTEEEQSGVPIRSVSVTDALEKIDRDQITPQSLTLSSLPKSHWENLFFIDEIRERNKPIAPPTKPEAAPFFLQTEMTPDGRFTTKDDFMATLAASTAQTDDSTAGPLRVSTLDVVTNLAKHLREGYAHGDYTGVMTYLKSLPPAAVDAEIQQLASLSRGAQQDIALMMEFLSWQLETNTDFELAEAYMSVLLKRHGDVIARDSALHANASELSAAHEAAWTRLQTMLHNNRCLLAYFCNLPGEG